MSSAVHRIMRSATVQKKSLKKEIILCSCGNTKASALNIHFSTKMGFNLAEI